MWRGPTDSCSSCLRVCLLVCLFVCLFVCLGSNYLRHGFVWFIQKLLSLPQLVNCSFWAGSVAMLDTKQLDVPLF